MPNDDEDSLEEGGITASKIPVRAWMTVSEAKPPNIILFFPLNAYILIALGRLFRKLPVAYFT